MKPNPNEKERQTNKAISRKVQVTIRKDQVIWLRKMRVIVPSQILQKEIDEMMKLDP